MTLWPMYLAVPVSLYAATSYTLAVCVMHIGSYAYTLDHIRAEISPEDLSLGLSNSGL